MHPRDDSTGGDRRQYRRIEDSQNANYRAQLESLSRIVVRHEAWFEDMGVPDMGLKQKQALPATLDRTVRWSRRDRQIMGAIAVVGPVIVVVLEKLFLVHH